MQKIATLPFKRDTSYKGKALKIETFDNKKGGTTFFKAIGHPGVVDKIKELLNILYTSASVGIFDPFGFFESFAQIYDCSKISLHHVFVQSYEDLNKVVLGHSVQPITVLKEAQLETFLIAAFDAERFKERLKPFLPKKTQILSFDDFRLPDEMLTDKQAYLSPLNFATNFAFFQDQEGLHTRLTTTNYWSIYNGGHPITLWCNLRDEHGVSLATWTEYFNCPAQTIVLDSCQLQQKLGLKPFLGQLFLHVIGAAGHDVVKYALDIYSDQGDILTCTHDANSWPADFYAGLPAPEKDEDVIVWVQNSHPCSIPEGSIGLAVMGSEDVKWYEDRVPPWGTVALNTKSLFPSVQWPQQFEIYSGKYFVRPRYEIRKKNGQKRVAHANVERTDLEHDPVLTQLTPWFGKGFILPIAILPRKRWQTVIQPTPMATQQKELPLALMIYDQSGKQIAYHPLGILVRNDSREIKVEDLLQDDEMEAGHAELLYDLSVGRYVDGWLHGLFRYYDIYSHSIAETSFGAHIFNMLLTYKSEPQSYAGPAPGLSTRLFLRIGDHGLKTICHLIYPTSTQWHSFSATQLQLHNSFGKLVATKEVKIPCNGSLFWVVEEMFEPHDLAEATDKGYVIIRDTTCRLFGYHGLSNQRDVFSFDHMFGF